MAQGLRDFEFGFEDRDALAKPAVPVDDILGLELRFIDRQDRAEIAEQLRRINFAKAAYA